MAESGPATAQAPRSVCASFWVDGLCPYGDACTLLHVRNPKDRAAASSPAHRLPSALAVEMPQPPPLHNAAAAARSPPASPMRLPAPAPALQPALQPRQQQPGQQQPRQEHGSPAAGAGAEESSTPATGRRRAPPKATAKTSKTRCMFFQKGRCLNTSEGGECPFLHEFDPPRPGRPLPPKAAFRVAAEYEARKAAALHPDDPAAAAAAAAQATDRVMQLQEERTRMALSNGQPRVSRAVAPRTAPGHGAADEDGHAHAAGRAAKAKPGQASAEAAGRRVGVDLGPVSPGAGPRAGARPSSPASGNISSRTLAGYHSQKPCRFFFTAEGCRNGDACGHSHDPEKKKAYAERRSDRQTGQGSETGASRTAA
jgi:hypothetical protein